MMTPYDQLGGAEALHHLVDRFYHHMDTLPEAARVRALHGADLSPANQKLFMFLSGWLGGPNLFMGIHGCGPGIFPLPLTALPEMNGCCACSWRWMKFPCRMLSGVH
jgi:hypothetical protein